MENCSHEATVNITEGFCEVGIEWCKDCGAYRVDQRASTGERPSTFELGEWVQPEIAISEEVVVEVFGKRHALPGDHPLAFEARALFRFPVDQPQEVVAETMQANASEAFDYDRKDQSVVIGHLEAEYRRWWERTDQTSDPHSNYTFGETAWLAAHGIERT